ncbi:MAG: RagB/SusD family nutrient uptake outer membrane protein [Janthinobacterium lividum]
MKKIFPILAASAVLVFSSCDKRLDQITPANTVLATDALNTSADVQSLLTGAYAVIGSSDLYGGRFQYSADLLGDPLGGSSELFWQGTFTQPNELYRKRILVNNSFVASTWTQAYRAINIANTVLANLGKVAKVQQDQVEGGAKFIRGAMYFELVRLYGRAWNDGDPNTNLAVPIILTATNVNDPDAVLGTTAKVARNTVAAVYAQAIKDLSDAETKLTASAPGSATATFFATTYAASGMLSRVYLQQGRYALAATEANRVISSGIYRLTTPIADEFNSKINTNEDIFATQVTVQSGINDLNTYYSQTGRGGDIAVQDALYNAYDPADDRSLLFAFTDNGTLTTKFDQVYGNIHEMRLAEMYLTRAEGNFRAGTKVGAAPVDDINVILERAKLPPVASVTLADILAQRHLELAFEGFYLHDLKRNALPVGTLAYTSPRLVFPIPQREIDVNSNLTQNAGY